MVTVGEGDSIFTLATRFQITPQSIINDNQLVPPFTIQPGEQLKLSPARYHIVVITDDLYSLSQRYAVSREQLAALNDLQESRMSWLLASNYCYRNSQIFLFWM